MTLVLEILVKQSQFQEMHAYVQFKLACSTVLDQILCRMILSLEMLKKNTASVKTTVQC